MDLLKFLESQAQKKTVGTLTLGKKNNFREIFFQGESVYLVGEYFSGKVAVRKLTELGIPGERISAESFETSLHEIDRSRRLFAEHLLEQELITEEELNQVATEQILEELTDILFRTQHSFHFQDERVPEYLLKCEDVTVRLPVPISRVITALRERLDLWKRFEAAVPSREEIFVLTERGMALRHGGGSDRLLVQALGLIDGMRDLNSILHDTYYYESYVVGALLRALEDGLIKKTIHPELRGISTHTLTREDAERCLPWFKNAIKYGADELAARERLAVVYEKIDRLDEAVIQYNYIGDSLYRMRKTAKAMKAYQKALQLKPDEILVTEKITKIYGQAASEEIANGNTAQAIQFLLGALRIRPADRDIFGQAMPLLIKERRLEELAELCDWIFAYARKSRSAEVALEACRDILKELPGNAAFRKKLINIYLDFGRTAEASTELLTLARQYLERGQKAKAQELIEKIRRLGVGGSVVRHIERQVATVRRGRPRLKVRRIVLLCSFALAVYQVWTYAAWMKIEEATSTADAARDPRSTVVELGVSRAEERYGILARQCEEFIAKHPISLWRFEADRLRGRLEESSRRITHLRSQKKLELLDAARKAAAEGQREEAQKLLTPILSLKGDEVARSAALEIQSRLNHEERTAEELLADARKLEEAGDAKAAYAVYSRLLQAYPQSQLVTRVRLPVLVESVPPGAEVTQVSASGETRVLGKTPHTVSLPPGGVMDLQLRLPGHAPLDVEIQEADGSGKRHFLDRKREWSSTGANRTEPWPSFTQDLVLLGLEAGGLASLDISTGKPAWRFRPDSKRTLVAPPVEVEDGLVTLWNTGHLVVFQAPQGVKGADGSASVAQDVKTDVFLESLATSALYLASRSPYILVGTRAGLLKAYSRKSREFVWSLSFDSPPERITEIEDDLLLALQNGVVARVRVNPPSVVWKRQIGSTGTQEILHTGKAVLALGRKGDIVHLKSENGETAHVRSLPPGTRAVISRADQRLLTLSAEGKLATCSAETIEELRSQTAEPGMATLQPVPGGIVLLSTDRKRLLLYHAETLEPLLSARTPRAIVSVAANSAWLIVTTEDGEVSAYPRG